MTAFFSYCFVFCAGCIAIPVVIFSLEILTGILFPIRKSIFAADRDRQCRVGVLVPAHNESANLLPTLSDLKAQLLNHDRLLVVADNCTDDTASIAHAAGAEVLERSDALKQGKGYALEHGLRRLALDPPNIVMIVDADCRLSEGAIDKLVAECISLRRPVQAYYEMTAPDQSTISYEVSEFAWYVKNLLRPLGLRALRMPCQLSGTGMAFPWEIISSGNLATGSIVEDLKLGLDLAQRGQAPSFCPSAKVSSVFPVSSKAAQSQRTRWEQGHIGMICRDFPRYLAVSILRRNIALFILALDLAIPPLSLFVIILGGMTFATAAAKFIFGISVFPFILSASSFALFIAAIFVAWLIHGRDILPLNSIPSILSYVAKKLPIYRHVMTGRSTKRWVKTDRQ